jgi:hypothetical protein
MQHDNLTAKDHYEVLQSCYDYFQRLIPGIERLVAGLRHDPESCFKDLSDAFEGISWLALAFIQTHEMHKIEIDTAFIYDTQTAVIDALSGHDYNEVADVLEHRALPMLKGWFETLDQEYGYEDSAPPQA